jgi:hypothetical protein
VNGLTREWLGIIMISDPSGWHQPAGRRRLRHGPGDSDHDWLRVGGGVPESEATVTGSPTRSAACHVAWPAALSTVAPGHRDAGPGAPGPSRTAAGHGAAHWQALWQAGVTPTRKLHRSKMLRSRTSWSVEVSYCPRVLYHGTLRNPGFSVFHLVQW